MTSACRSVLFLSHSASRNGASILLLHLLQWLRANTDLDLEVLCEGRGSLVDDFRAVATTHVWPSVVLPPHDGAARRLDAVRERIVAPVLRACLERRRYDLVYANTTATWNHVAALARPGVPLLWHIHELPYALALTLPTPRTRALLARATRLVAVSGAVEDALVQGCGVRRERVDVVQGFVPLRVVATAERDRLRRRLLEAFGWPSDAFVVGACGTPGWRKGSDLFLQAARRALDGAGVRPLRFLWVGGGDDRSIEGLQFDHDVRALGLADSCRRVPAMVDVDEGYGAMDVFALTSREDPFPLVMLEAAVHGLPTLCFEGAGGGAEFAAQDAGIVVPYGDVAALGRVFVDVSADAPLLQRLGEGARRKVGQHHGIETQAPRMLRSMEHCMIPDQTAVARMAHP